MNFKRMCFYPQNILLNSFETRQILLYINVHESYFSTQKTKKIMMTLPRPATVTSCSGFNM